MFNTNNKSEENAWCTNNLIFFLYIPIPSFEGEKKFLTLNIFLHVLFCTTMKNREWEEVKKNTCYYEYFISNKNKSRWSNQEWAKVLENDK